MAFSKKSWQYDLSRINLSAQCWMGYAIFFRKALCSHRQMVERSNIHENHQNDLGSNPAFMLGAAGLEPPSLWEYLSTLALYHFANWANGFPRKILVMWFYVERCTLVWTFESHFSCNERCGQKLSTGLEWLEHQRSHINCLFACCKMKQPNCAKLTSPLWFDWGARKLSES